MTHSLSFPVSPSLSLFLLIKLGLTSCHFHAILITRNRRLWYITRSSLSSLTLLGTREDATPFSDTASVASILDKVNKLARISDANNDYKEVSHKGLCCLDKLNSIDCRTTARLPPVTCLSFFFSRYAFVFSCQTTTAIYQISRQIVKPCIVNILDSRKRKSKY